MKKNLLKLPLVRKLKIGPSNALTFGEVENVSECVKQLQELRNSAQKIYCVKCTRDTIELIDVEMI